MRQLQKRQPNQADYDRILKHICEPMAILFDLKVSDVLRDALIEDLMNFSNDELQEGFVMFRRSQKHMPRTTAPVYEACMSARAALKAEQKSEGIATGDFIQQLQAKEERARKLSSDYSENFMATSAIAREAREFGYEPELRRYVNAVAWIQAQYIAEIRNKGVDWYCIFNRGKDISDSDIRQLLSEVKRQAQTGSIDVGVPSSHLEHWRTYASRKPMVTVGVDYAAPDGEKSGQFLLDPNQAKSIGEKLEEMQF